MPFARDAFFAVFAAYNEAIWPLQIVLIIAGLAALALLVRPSMVGDRVILGVLAVMWAVNGVLYHWLHFAAINPAARLFAALFVVQAGLLAWAAMRQRSAPLFSLRNGPWAVVGAIIAVFALAGYAALGLLAGHSYPAVPVFGVAPCPTTIFTLGVLMAGRWRDIRLLAAIPLVWSGIGGSAALLLGVPQDYALILSGLLLAAAAVMRWTGRGMA